ncbi:MAG: hypothetical protein IKO40_07715 [Kiritimatiellae bacterium]|nr:hypothetical protein [Kiritimatiellia bacterium]
MAEYLDDLAAKAASAQNQKQDRRRTRGDRPLVYLTDTYNLYDPRMTAICESYADQYTRNKGFGAADRDMFVDACRDELARIMESYHLARNSSPHAYARMRLASRVNDIWEKFRTRLKRQGRLVSLSEPSASNPCRTVAESAEFLKAMDELDEERAAEARRNRQLERMEALTASMPRELKNAMLALKASDGNQSKAAARIGVTQQTFNQVWIPKLRKYLLDNGIMGEEEDGDEA